MPGYHNHYNDNSFQRGRISLSDGRICDSVEEAVRQSVADLRRKGEHVVIAAKQALKDGANIILADMQRRVPIYKLPKGRKRPPKHVTPGLLQRSIQYDVLEDGAIYEFQANARNPYDGFLYGPIVEFSEWHMWKGKRRKKEKQAFMYPALDDHWVEVREMVKNAINQAIARGH